MFIVTKLLRTLLLFCCVIVTNITTVAYAQEAVPEVGKHVGNMDVVNVLISLLLVLAVIVISAWVLKRFQLAPQSSQSLKVITSLHVGTKEKIVVVQVNDKQLLLGVTAHSVNVLDHIDTPIKTNEPLSSEVSASLSKQLTKLFKK